MSSTVTGIAIVVAVLGVLGANTLRAPLGWSPAEHTPEALARTLQPYYRSTVPQGRGRFPTALLFSGCDGPKDNLEVLAEALAEAGWASIIVDSHTPRSYGEYERWRLICSGQLLSGAERAADVAVAVDDARRMDFVDPDRLALIGASHGGWAVLDFLALASDGRVPPILDSWPESFRTEGLDGIRSVVALYPYCGPLSIAAREGWSVPVPSLFLLVEDDTIVNETECRALAEREMRRGVEVEIGTFRGVTHGFDQAEKSALSTLEFNPDARAAALREITAFLDR